MFTGSYEDLDAILKTAPWGTEQMICSVRYELESEEGWSVLMLVDPLHEESEGLVYAYNYAKTRAALIALTKAKTAANSFVSDEAGDGPMSLIRLQSLLQRSDESGLV